MKVALIGYGKMGREIEKAALEKGIEIVAKIDPRAEDASHKELTADAVEDADVLIDFTTPDAAVENIKKAAQIGKNIVVATTGWYDDLDEVKKAVQEGNIGLIYSPNFSIGVNIFYRIIDSAAELMNKVEDYDAFGYELHHNQKVDSPSGTAKAIEAILLSKIARKERAIEEKLDRKIEPEELHFASVRAGSIPGTHIVGFDSAADTIELKHVARSRAGFAAGALMAAEWLVGKTGLFTIEDFMRDFFG